VAARPRRSEQLAQSAIVAGSSHLEIILERMATELGSAANRHVTMPRLPAAVVSAAEYVSHHHREKLRTQDLARAVSVSPFELAQAFRKSIGITAKDS
jgi:YesN/AraC family two-component response regulator